MIKNTAGQKVGAQLVSATDGSAFTGSVTVSVTVDAGTQATGSVGAGAAAHEGNGYHTYAPAQAETNGDLIAFTFTGTGAVPQTVQIYTRSSLTTQEKADVNAEVVDALVTDIVADSIPADGSRPSIAQALYMVVQFLHERAVSGTTVTVKKSDGTTGLLTLTLDDATNPTSITRAT